MPLVSVIMPVFNGEKYLEEAIDSILGQTFTDFELLIVDDGSQDGSADIIRNYQALDSRVRLIQLELNSGAADARNHAISAANGDLITMMDCDDVSLPQRLQKQVDFLRSNTGIGGVGTCGRAVNHDLGTLLFPYIVPSQHALIAFSWFFGDSFLGATIMLRREFLRAVGGYEPGRRAVEDREMFSRLLSDTDIKFSNLQEELLIYRRYEGSNVTVQGADAYKQDAEIRKRVVKRLWSETPPRSLERLNRLRMKEKLGWRDRRAAKNDMRRLINSLIAHNWVEAEDKPLLIADMNRRLEQASPRIWQMFCHWRRHRLGF